MKIYKVVKNKGDYLCEDFYLSEENAQNKLKVIGGELFTYEVNITEEDKSHPLIECLFRSGWLSSFTRKRENE